MDVQAVTPGNGTNETKKHIVDVLIEERAERLVASPLWPVYRSLLYPLLGHKRATQMANEIANLPGFDVMHHVSGILDLDINVSGLEHLPKDGRVLVAATHPTGIPDGIAMFDALKERRPDMVFYANRDAIRVAPALEDIIIPVEWVDEKRTPLRSRETLAGTKKAFQAEKCVVLFPSGRLGLMGKDKRLIEQDWLPSVAAFARKYDCPVTPVHIEMRNSWLYYWFSNVNTELRDITLFHELLNKKGKSYEITFGPLIAPTDLRGDTKAVASALREHAMALGNTPTPWRPIEADPIPSL